MRQGRLLLPMEIHAWTHAVCNSVTRRPPGVALVAAREEFGVAPVQQKEAPDCLQQKGAQGAELGGTTAQGRES